MAPTWHQVFIPFPHWHDAEHTAVNRLHPVLLTAEQKGVITSWSFLRKHPCWRLRYLAATPEATTLIHHTLDTLHTENEIGPWTEVIYEPETHAFGGTTAMHAAHRFFHQDSHHLLAHLATGRDQRRELAVLLPCALLRAAGQDWFEQGDIWARVTEHRPNTPHTELSESARAEFHTNLRRLMTVDPAPLTRPDTPLAHISGWADAYTTCGRHLADLARHGRLDRGIRAVLTHHIIFAWNRLGIPSTTQHLLADTARHIVFNEEASAATNSQEE